MSSIRTLLLGRLRPRPYVRPTTDRQLTVRRDHVEPTPFSTPAAVPEPRADDHLTAAKHTAPLGRCDEITPPVPKPPEASPPREPSLRPVGQAWPSPRTWLNATVTEVDRAREDRQLARLAALTERLGSPLAAAQHLYAPHLRKDNDDA